jgi:small subunit ribosomal protein S8
MSTDTTADMLTRIRNCNIKKYKSVQVPFTKLNRNIAEVLFTEGLIESFEELKKGGKSSLRLGLKYTKNERKPSISKIQRISKPGFRIYSNVKKMPKVLGGFGISIVSTSHGLMTGKKAREKGLGGELLCYVW